MVEKTVDYLAFYMVDLTAVQMVFSRVETMVDHLVCVWAFLMVV